ncbi:MAG: hypothetical protein OXI79_19590 [Gammaproteobacteria bacterium]|nr:hypothetical protein [Gammaproteobacteria bacterium]
MTTAAGGTVSPVADRTRRPRRVVVRFTDDELAEVVHAANRDGLSVSCWLRMTGLREARSRSTVTLL